MSKQIEIPLHALVVIVGPSGAGKSTLIESTFSAHEVVSSDAIRAELTGDFRDQHQNNLAFEVYHRRIATKLSIGERVVADATHLRKKDRVAVANIGATYHVPVYYLVVNRPVEEKLATGGWRLEVPNLIEKHEATFNSQLKDILSGDGMATVIDMRTEASGGQSDDIVEDNIYVVQKSNFDNLEASIKSDGFDGITVVGDIHGMARDFQDVVDATRAKNHLLLSLGDLVDYGPDSAQCIDIMYHLIMAGEAIMVLGNHEKKFEKYIHQYRDGKVMIKTEGGIAETIAQFNGLDDYKRELVEDRFLFIMNHVRHHFIIGDDMFAHAAATAGMWNIKASRLVGIHENRAVFGQIDQDVPRDPITNFPHRIYDWVDEIPEGKTVYVGHAVLDMEKIVTKTGSQGGKAVFLDTGSAKGGMLSTFDIKF